MILFFDGCLYCLCNLYLLYMDVYGLLGLKIDVSCVVGVGVLV